MDLKNENVFTLEGHEFLSSQNMDCLYVIDNAEHAPLPVITRSYDLTVGPGISFELLGAAETGYSVRLTSGNAFTDALPENVVRAGRVIVETKDSVSGNAYKRLTAYFNGGKLDKGNLTVTAAGIGITDILSADPLLVSLVSAPLTVLKDAQGGERQVRGVYVEYLDYTENTYTREAVTSKIWGFQIILVPQAS